MKLKISKRDLAKHISIVQRAISNRTTMQILEGILIQTVNGKLKLTATDTEISIETYVDAIIYEEGEIVVNSKIFGDIIRKLPNSNIMIEISGSNINIKCEQSEFNINGQNTNEYPSLPEVSKKNILSINADIFKNAIRLTSFAVSLDDTRMALTGVLMDIKENSTSFVALDGYRMALKKIDMDNGFSFPAIIPGRSCSELTKIMEEDIDNIEIIISDNYISLDLGDTKFYTKLLSGDFFQYEGLIREEHLSVVKVNKNSMQDSLERASLLAKEEKANLVKLNINQDSVEITSNSEIGNVSEVVYSKLEGDSLKIAFNSKYLIDGIKIIESEEISMNFTDSINPCIIKSEDDNSYIYLVLPVRLAN